VYIVDNLSTGSLQNVAHCQTQESFHFIQADICNKDEIENVFADILPDVVYHLAAQINVRHSIQDPLYCSQINIIGTVNLLEVMRKFQCTRIIFASTGGVMFSTDKPPYSEADIPSPNTPYGISKHCSEELIAFYSREYFIVSTILRYANVFGSRQDPQ
jgi:UDP-glucose 4-epimerase